MNYLSKLTLAASIAAALGLAACKQQSETETAVDATEQATEAPVAVVDTTAELGSGIDMSGFDPAVRAQDDLFVHVNGKWVAETEMPADKARWGTFDRLVENSQKDVRALVEEVSATATVEPGSATQKIRDFFNAYLDSERPNELGIEAIRAELDQVAAIETTEDLFRAFATLGVYGVDSPIAAGVFSDMKDPDTNVVYIVESGITLPDRDYYLKDDEQFVQGRELYRAYV